MAIIHSLKCTVPFSFVVRLLSLALTHCYLLSLVVTRCITRCHSLSLVVPLVVTRCHSLSFVVTRCTTRCHLLSLIVPLVAICCHSLSLDVPLVCFFINDQTQIYLYFLKNKNIFICKSFQFTKHSVFFTLQEQVARVLV